MGIFLFALVLVHPIKAAVRCETQYGGSQVCVQTGQLQVNKKVCDPGKGGCDDNGNFVDNLTDANRFLQGNEVVYKIEIKNVGDATFDKIAVRDTLPSQLQLTSGDLNFDIASLAPGQTAQKLVKTKVVNMDNTCPINTAEAQSGDQKDRDTSQICLGAGKPSLPQAGPQDWLMVLGLSALAGATGTYLLLNKRRYL